MTNLRVMDHRAIQFATRGHCIKVKQCHPITVENIKKIVFKAI